MRSFSAPFLGGGRADRRRRWCRVAGVTSSAEGGDEGRRDRTDQVGLANMEARSGDSDECWSAEGEGEGEGEG